MQRAFCAHRRLPLSVIGIVAANLTIGRWSLLRVASVPVDHLGAGISFYEGVTHILHRPTCGRTATLPRRPSAVVSRPKSARTANISFGQVNRQPSAGLDVLSLGGAPG